MNRQISHEPDPVATEKRWWTRVFIVAALILAGVALWIALRS